MRQLVLLLSVAVAACNVVQDEPPDMQTLKESRPVGNAKALAVNLQYDVGELEIHSDRGPDLFSLNLTYDQSRSTPKFDFRENGDRSTLELSMDSRIRLHNNHLRNDLSLRLNEKVPLDLDLTTGVSDAHLDMTDLEIERFHLRGGVGRTEVSFDRPVETAIQDFEVESGVGNLSIRGLGNARFDSLKVDGGVGRTELDFTGQIQEGRLDAEINVGVGQVRLMLPRESAITIEADGSFLSNISAPGFDKDGRTYSHAALEGNARKIFIRIRSGVGGVTVELQ